jgi:DNA repair protein RecN (Recombination protein N)
MLVELNISNFAIIDQLTLRFDQGFNVLTGETGAGKSIIIDAVNLVLGGRADTTYTRADTSETRVECIFHLTAGLRGLIDPILEEEGLEGDDPETLILGRELRSSGRNFCRINGRTVNASLLKRVAEPLIDIHGQQEHLSLLRVREHQRMLDRYAGLDEPRLQLAAEVRRLNQVRWEVTELLRDAQKLARRVDQLSFQVEEIEAANLQPGEEATLNIERNRLANAEQLSQVAGEAYRLLIENSDEQPSAADLVGQAARLVGQLARLDQSLVEQQQAIDSLSYQLEDLAETLRDYSEAIDFDPARLQEVEERLALVFNLKRKYGDTVEEIIAFGRQAQVELDAISHSEERLQTLRKEEDMLRHKIGGLALTLSKARRQAGLRLADEVLGQLADLGMAKADFTVEIKWQPDPDGVFVPDESGETFTLAYDERGIDQIEFLISANPGEPLKPLIKVASGGETSRIMLALKTVLALADETPTLIFDEIDQGIGGRVGRVVGRKLWGLTQHSNHQVLCITHLPQIAGYATTHYHVSKEVEGNRTRTIIRPLEHEDRVDELAQMLGALSESTRQSAREILTEATASQGRAESGPAAAQGVLL